MSDTEGNIPQTVVDDVKTKKALAEVFELTHDPTGSSILVRSPTRDEFRRFRAEMNVLAKRPDGPENLLRACVVYPEPAEFSAMLAKRPGLVETFGNSLLELAGFNPNGAEKKAR